MLFLLLAVADPETGPVEAERAMYLAAQAKGQWTALRERMADGAIIVSPQGASSDGTLIWHWHVSNSGARTFLAWLWDGEKLVPIIENEIAAPRAK